MLAMRDMGVVSDIDRQLKAQESVDLAAYQPKTERGKGAGGAGRADFC